MIIYPKPSSIYLRGTIGEQNSLQNRLEKELKFGLMYGVQDSRPVAGMSFETKAFGALLEVHNLELLHT